jgi:hypothetical protein
VEIASGNSSTQQMQHTPNAVHSAFRTFSPPAQYEFIVCRKHVVQHGIERYPSAAHVRDTHHNGVREQERQRPAQAAKTRICHQ